jgi:cbb3-type cytochrome oxidase cytochrome c subunit
MNGYRLGATGIVVTFFTIITSTVLLPMVLFNPKPSGHGNDYKNTIFAKNDVADPLRGRQIYVREGCFYCHTQFTRLQDRGYGPLVKAGDYVQETPHVLGTARTGPDLTNEGGRFPSEWQKAHLIQPRALKPGSIMPSFSYLSDRDMNDLVAYIQTLGNMRKVDQYYDAPEEYKLIAARRKTPPADDAQANAGRGIYTQNCAACHGLQGLGNGPNSLSLEKKPANFTRPIYKAWRDDMWFYRITEGVPGTRMPRFGEVLSEEQRWYLVAYLKTLPRDKEEVKDVNPIEAIRLPKLSNQLWEPASGGHDSHSHAADGTVGGSETGGHPDTGATTGGAHGAGTGGTGAGE